MFVSLGSCSNTDFYVDYIVNKSWTETFVEGKYRALDNRIYYDVAVDHTFTFYKDRTGAETFWYSYYNGNGELFQDEFVYEFDWFWSGGSGVSDNVTINYVGGGVAYLNDMSTGYRDGFDILYCTYSEPGKVSRKMILFEE